MEVDEDQEELDDTTFTAPEQNVQRVNCRLDVLRYISDNSMHFS